MLFKTFFFRLSICAFVANNSPTELCDGVQMAIFWRFFASCISVSHVQHVLDLHPKFALRPHRHTMCGSMVDIQSATAEIRRGKKNKEETTGQKYNVRICYAGRP